MSQAGGGGGGALARAIVEITGSVEPLKAKLAEAEAATKSSADKMAQASGGGAEGGGAADGGAGAAKDVSASLGAAAAASADAAKEAQAFSASMSSAVPATKKTADGTKETAENTKEAGKQAGFLNIGVAATAGAIAGVVRAANELWKGIKGFQDGARALAADLKAIEDTFRSDVRASLDPLSARTQEIENARIAGLAKLEDERKSRGILGDIVALVTDEAEAKVKAQKIEAEAAAAQQRNREAGAREAKKAEEDAKAAEQKGAEDAAKKARDLYIGTLDEKGQLQAKFEDEAIALTEKANSAKTEAERNSYLEAIAYAEQIKDKKIADIDEAATKQAEADAKSTADKLAADQKADAELMAQRAKAAQEFADLQKQAVSALRNEINALFNTGNIEVGIGRLNELMDVLISKTGDR